MLIINLIKRILLHYNKGKKKNNMLSVLILIFVLDIRNCLSATNGITDLNNPVVSAPDEETLHRIKTICPQCFLNDIDHHYNDDDDDGGDYHYDKQITLGGLNNFGIDAGNLLLPKINIFDNSKRDKPTRKHDLSLFEQHITNGGTDDNKLHQDSREDAYVFLNKGKTSYFPLNPYEKPVVKHYPINIDGSNVHLPDWKILQNTGLLGNLFGLNRYLPYSIINPGLHNYLGNLGLKLRKQDKTLMDYQKDTLRRLFCSERKDNKQHNDRSNNFYPKNSHNRHFIPDLQQNGKSPYSPHRSAKNDKNKNSLNGNRDLEILKQFICEPDFIEKVYRTSGDCGSKKRKENFASKKTTTTIQGHNYLVEYDDEPTLGNIHHRDEDINEDFEKPHPAYTEVSMSYAKPEEEKNFTTIHTGVVQISKLEPNVHVENSSSVKIENTTPNNTPRSMLTDSPIYYIKIHKGRKKSKKQQQNHQENFPTTDFNDAKNSASTNNLQIITDPNDPLLQATENRYTYLSPLENQVTEQTQSLTKEEHKLLDNVLTTLESTNTGTEEIMTTLSEPDMGTISKPINDLQPSENKLNEYVMKSKNKGTEFSTHIKNHSKRQTKIVEPIAYETYLMKSTHEPSPTTPTYRLKKHFKSKPKRFVQLRALDINIPKDLDLGPHSHRSNGLTTTTTTSPPFDTTEFSIQQGINNESPKVGSTQFNNFNHHDNRIRNSRRRKPKLRKSYKKTSRDMQIIGTARYDYDDSCEDLTSEYPNVKKSRKHKKFGKNSRHGNKIFNAFNLNTNSDSKGENEYSNFNDDYYDPNCNESLDMEKYENANSNSVESSPITSVQNVPC